MITTFKSGTTTNETPSGTLQSGTVTTSQVVRQLTFADGSGTNQAHQTFSAAETIAASGTLSLDLHAFGGALDALDNAYALSRIVVLHVRNQSTDPTAIVTIEPDTTANPWEGLSGTTGVITNALQPGGEFIVVAPLAAALPVSAGSKALKFINQSATAQAVLDIQVVGS